MRERERERERENKYHITFLQQYLLPFLPLSDTDNFFVSPFLFNKNSMFGKQDAN